MFLIIPASIGLMVLAAPLIEVFFRHGHFDKVAASRTSWVIFFYCVGLWGQSAVFVMLRAFYALKDTKSPVRVSVAMVALNVALNLSVVWFLEEKGLALTTAICGIIQFVVLYVILRRRIGSLGGRDIAKVSAKTLSVSLLMGAFAFAAWYWFWPSGAGVLVRIAALAGIVAVASGIFVSGAWALKMPELKRVLKIG